MARANDELRRQWRARLAELESSGLSIAEFARRHSLNVKSLYSWRERLSDTALRARTSSAKPNKPQPSFVELRAKSARDGKLCIRVGGEYTITLGNDFETQALERLLDVLEQR